MANTEYNKTMLTPLSGQKIKDDGTVVNVAELIEQISTTGVTVDATGLATEVNQIEMLARNPKPYFGNSGDVKPTIDIATGSTFFEIDTSIAYMWDGTSWVVL